MGGAPCEAPPIICFECAAIFYLPLLLCHVGAEVHQDLLRIVNETMPSEEELYDLAELFKVFGDSTRIRILYVLFETMP